MPSGGRGGTAAVMMAQNEQTTQEHSTLEQQSPGRLDHPTITPRGPAKNWVNIDGRMESECTVYFDDDVGLDEWTGRSRSG